MIPHGWPILIGILMGTAARLYMLRSDYRHYPGYPHGFVTHLSLGFIASVLGALAIPALAEKEFTAATFLALAAQQFREVRNLERESLAELEENELVPRGKDYIEGIARVFEARNYLAMLVSLLASAVTFWGTPLAGFLAGSAAIAATTFFMRGQMIGDIAEVRAATPVFQGAILTVEGITLVNIGLKKSREKLIREGLACLIKPKDDNARATLNDIGQRQAIVHTAATLLGAKQEIGELDWVTLARKNIDTGEIALFILACEPDIRMLLEAVRRVPVLESAVQKPLSTVVGRTAAD